MRGRVASTVPVSEQGAVRRDVTFFATPNVVLVSKVNLMEIFNILDTVFSEIRGKGDFFLNLYLYICMAYIMSIKL